MLKNAYSNSTVAFELLTKGLWHPKVTWIVWKTNRILDDDLLAGPKSGRIESFLSDRITAQQLFSQSVRRRFRETFARGVDLGEVRRVV